MGKIALPIIPVVVSGLGESNTIEMYALLDTGSNRSFCTDAQVDQLKISGRTEKITLTTLDNLESVESVQVVSLQVEDITREKAYLMPTVLSRAHLNVSIDNLVSAGEIGRWPHLKNISFPDVDASDVHLLIGQDVPDVLIPREARRGGSGEPYATKTALGWTFNGPFERGRTWKSTSHFVNTDTDLQKQVEKFWSLDDYVLNQDEPDMSISNRKVVSLWENSISHNGSH